MMTDRWVPRPDEPDALARTLEHLLEDVPSVSGVVAWLETRDGRSLARSAGWSSQERLDPMPVDASFRLASNTKTFAAATTLRMVEDGLLSLDDPIVGLLPREATDVFRSVRGFRHLDDILLVHLLGHTSGIPTPVNDEYMETVLREPTKRWEPMEQIRFFAGDQPPNAPPGSEAVYSDTGYVVLSLIIEAVAGTDLARAYRRYLGFQRLGLTSTYLETCEDPPPGLGPRAHQYFGTVDVSAFDPSFDLYAAGGLVSSSRDLCRFWRALFTGEVFRHEASLRAMCTCVPFRNGVAEAGLGVFLASIAGKPMWAHSGYFGSFAVHDPASGTTAVGVANQAGSEWPKGRLDDLMTAVMVCASGTSWSSG